MIGKVLFDVEPPLSARRDGVLPPMQSQGMGSNAYITLEYNEEGPLLTADDIDVVVQHDAYLLSWSGLRLSIIRREGGACTVSFPPFASPIIDAHVERVGARQLRLLVIVSDEVHVALLEECSDKLIVAASTSMPISFAPARLHRVDDSHFALIDTHGRVHGFTCDVQLRVEFSGASLQLLQAVCRILSGNSYVDSVYVPSCQMLFVLTTRQVSAWQLDEALKDVVVITTLPLSEVIDDSERVAAIVASGTCDAIVICRSGACIPLCISECKSGRQLSAGAVARLPRDVMIRTVSCACSSAGTLLLYDAVGCTLTVLVEDALVYDDGGFAPVTLVSQVDLAERVTGIVVEACDAYAGDSGAVFALYGTSALLLRLRRHGSGALLMRKFDVNVYETTLAMQHLPPSERASMLFRGALCGLASDRVGHLWDELCVPSLLGVGQACASPAAQCVARWVRERMSEAVVMCDTPPHWLLAVRLMRIHDALECAHAALSSMLNRGGWLGVGTLPLLLRWTPALCYTWSSASGASGANEAMNMRDAINGQAVLWSELLRIMQQVGVVCWLYALLIQRLTKPSLCSISGKLRAAVQDDAVGELIVKLCACLLDTAGDDAELVTTIHARSDSLPKAAAALVHVHVLLRSQDGAAAALRYMRTHLATLRANHLLDELTTLLEKVAPELAPTVQLAVEQAAMDVNRVSDVVALVDSIPEDDKEKLCATMTHILHDRATTPALVAAMVRWMTDRPLDDPRLATLADIVAQFDLDIVEHGVVSRFFACWKMRQRGQGAAAARRFGELARTEGAMPLSLRLRCIAYATEDTAASEVDKMAHFTLLLQQQLSELIERGSSGGATQQGKLDDARVASELQDLRQHFLSERALFELAGRHRALGGASVQLDLLKAHPDIPESVIADVVLALLLFLHAGGISATDAVRCVLSNYLPCFAAPVPMRPFVDFCALEAVTIEEAIAVLLSCGVLPTVVFYTLLGILERQERVLFVYLDVLRALTSLVEQIEDDDSRRVCGEHLMDYLQAVVTGEYKVLDDDNGERRDMFALKSLEGRLQAQLDQISRWT